MKGRAPLRILHTEASLGWGGQEIRILTEAREFAAHGHAVHLLCDPDSDIFAAAPDFGLDATAVPLKRKSLAALRAVRAVFRRLAPEVVNSHSSIDHWLAAAARIGLERSPAIVRTRHISAPVSRNRPTRWLYNTGCEMVMTTSQVMVGELTGDGFLDPAHVAAVPTGIDIGRFKPGDRRAARQSLGIADADFMFGIVATLRSWKGHDDLLEAFARLSGGRAALAIVGDGPRRARIESEISRLGLGSRVILTGRQDDVVPYLQAMDAFVLTSYQNEGVPQALLQAMACEVPAIVTTVGGMPELVAGLSAVIQVPPRDIDALAQALDDMQTRAWDAAAIEGLRERVSAGYTLQRMYEKVLSAFTTATERVAPRRPA